MMNPDIRIAIAYGSRRTKAIAQEITKRLEAYSRKGYPVIVKIVAEDINKLKEELGDSGRQNEVIAEKMENYFINFDRAFFFFDTRGSIEDKDQDEIESVEVVRERKTIEVISANLLFEYGLASSTFRNTTINGMNSSIYSFSVCDINQDALQYFYRLNLHRLKYTDINNIAEYVITNYVHNQVVKKVFYGMNENLPNIIKSEKNDRIEYESEKECKSKDPMDVGDSNTYWPDLKMLTPTGLVVTLDKETSALRDYFVAEYKRFDIGSPIKKDVLVRQLLYIVDRAVLLMYLDKAVQKDSTQKDFWLNTVKVLINNIKKLALIIVLMITVIIY